MRMLKCLRLQACTSVVTGIMAVFKTNCVFSQLHSVGVLRPIKFEDTMPMLLLSLLYDFRFYFIDESNLFGFEHDKEL